MVLKWAATRCTAILLIMMVLSLGQQPEAATLPGTRDYPNRPIRIIDAFPPGGTTDYLARVIGQKLTERFGQPIIVDNRPGGGGVLGAEAAAKATPDGYTFFMVSVSSLAPSASMYQHLNFDVLKDFSHITLVASGGFFLVVQPGLAKSVPELIAVARSKPGEIRYGSSGVGGSQHLLMELLKRRAGVDMLHVPYKGGPAVAPAVASGEVHVGIPSIVAALPLVRSQRVIAIAVTGAKRAKDFPEIPTLAESGFPGLDGTPWFGLLAPAGTPSTIVKGMNAEIGKILQLPDIQAKFATQALEVIPSTPDRFKQLMQAEIEQWAKVIKDANIKAE